MKYLRYRKIKKVRRLRDELIRTSNEGRCMKLLMQLPLIKGYEFDCHDHYYGSGRCVRIWLRGGWTYEFRGYKTYLEYIHDAAEFIYKEWLKNRTGQ